MKKHEKNEEESEVKVDDSEEASESVDEAMQTEESEDSDEEQPKKGKQKKAVRRRKSKKEKENPITGAIRLAVESGKVEYGAKSMMNNAKLFVVSNSLPSELMMKIEGKAKEASVPILRFVGSSMELGSVCGCPFPVSVLSVINPGTSNILELADK